jgi:hypothetical protein
MKPTVRLWLTSMTFFVAAACATAPEVRSEAPPVPLEPVAVKVVFIPEKDDLFSLVDPLRGHVEARLAQAGHAISDRGWPIEIQLRHPELGTQDEHARVCVKLVGRVVRPQGRFAAVDVPAESCREANIYNPVNVTNISAAEIPNGPNGALYVEAIDILLNQLDRQARAPAQSNPNRAP